MWEGLLASVEEVRTMQHIFFDMNKNSHVIHSPCNCCLPLLVVRAKSQIGIKKHLWGTWERSGGSRREVITKMFYFILFPLFLIASHSPHPSFPILHLCLLYRLMARALGRGDEMGVKKYGKGGGCDNNDNNGGK
jgi:hypothetical protein